MYTTKRNHPKDAFVPQKDLPKHLQKAPQSYLSTADPYVKVKPKKDPLAKKPQFKSGKKFTPQDGTYVSTDEGCFARIPYINQGYGDRTFYKDKNLGKEKKAQACHRGAPFGSKTAPKKDEFHNHIRQLQYKEKLDTEVKFEKMYAARMAEKFPEAKESAKETQVTSPTRRKTVFDQHVAGGSAENFDNSWKMKTNTWINKKGYGIKKLNHGSMKPNSTGYGNFDATAITRPKHARVSIVSEFNDISHLG